MPATFFKRSVHTLLILCFPAATAAASPVQDLPGGKYTLDKTHASLIWKVSHLGLSDYTARFTDFDATIQFDPEKPEASTVKATINPASVRTDYPNAEEKDFDAKLAKGEKWFNSDAFPSIEFSSTEIIRTGDDTADIVGDLTFLGVTKPVTLETTLNGAMQKQPFAKKPAMGFSATATLKRSDWGFSTYVPTIGDDVTILIEAEFLKADDAQTTDEATSTEE